MISSSWKKVWVPVCMLLLAQGCGKKESTTGEKKPSRGLIGASLLTLQNPFFKVIGDSLTSEAAKHGYETVVLSAHNNVQTQSNQVEDFIVKRCAAIVLSPADSKSIVPVIKKANAEGIPVFTVDIPCNEPGVKIVTQIATDNFGGGREAATAMIEALGSAGGQVGVLDLKQVESCILRVKGFKEVIDQHNQTAVGKIQIVSELDGGGAKDQGHKAAEDMLQAFPGIRGIFAINDPSALGARAALEKSGKANQVIIIGFDGQPEGKQAIKDGKIYADPIQFPDKMGVEIAKAIVAHSKGQTLPPQTLIPTQLYRQKDGLADPELK